jgi:hypothetical protein
VKCRVCVALTVLGWPDLARECSGPLTVCGGGWFMDVRFLGIVRERVGEYIPSVLWGRIFQLVYYALLGFVAIPVVWDVSMINWIRGLMSSVLCSRMK